MHCIEPATTGDGRHRFLTVKNLRQSVSGFRQTTDIASIGRSSRECPDWEEPATTANFVAESSLVASGSMHSGKLNWTAQLNWVEFSSVFRCALGLKTVQDRHIQWNSNKKNYTYPTHRSNFAWTYSNLAKFSTIRIVLRCLSPIAGLLANTESKKPVRRGSVRVGLLSETGAAFLRLVIEMKAPMEKWTKSTFYGAIANEVSNGKMD